MEKGIQRLNFHGRSASHVELNAFRGFHLLEFVDDTGVVITILDTCGKDGGAVLRWSNRAHRLGEAFELAYLHDDVDKLLIGGVSYH